MKLSTDLTILRPSMVLHPRETLYNFGTMAAVNAVSPELFCDGAVVATFDLRDTFVGTVVAEGTVDGVNYLPIAVKSKLGGAWAVSATTQGAWDFPCRGFIKVRIRMTAYTSGSATFFLLVKPMGSDAIPLNTDLIVTATAASGAALTLTLPAPGAGFRQYLTYLRIVKFAAAALTAAAAPVIATSTNLPGNPAFTLPADAAPQGSVYAYQEDFNYPIGSTAQNTTTTIVMPATTGVLWRATAGYFINP